MSRLVSKRGGDSTHETSSMFGASFARRASVKEVFSKMRSKSASTSYGGFVHEITSNIDVLQ